MTQSTLHSPNQPGIHVAIIMDGNGRWALRRRLPRPAGHRRGIIAVRATVEAAAAPRSGIDILTLFTFSSDNWQRPPKEVAALMTLLERYLAEETPRCVEEGVRLQVIGRRDRLPRGLGDAIRSAEKATKGGGRLQLRLAIDYSSRYTILRAARRAAERAAMKPETASAGRRRAVRRDRDLEPGEELDAAVFGRLLGGPAPDVDLLIRTGGEQRLSDFLLWESAYAELYFTPVLWPDFGAANLTAALSDYRRRERRFGGLLEEAV